MGNNPRSASPAHPGSRARGPATIKVPKKGTLVGWFESQLAVPSYRPARLPVTDHLVPRTAGQPLALWFTLAKIYGRFYPEFNA